MTLPVNQDPIEAWCSAHSIVAPHSEHLTRFRLPGGLLELRTNCAAFSSYLAQRGCYLISDDADPPAVRAEVLCLPGTGWPGVWPEGQHSEADDMQLAAFHSSCRPGGIWVWHPPNLMGFAQVSGSCQIRLLATGSDPERFAVRGKFRAKGKVGVIVHAELFDLALCLVARLRGFTLLHGAVLEKRGRGLLLLGESGCGKTTASLALLNDGYRLLTDEYAVMWNTGERRGLFGGVLVPQMLIGSPPASLGSIEDTLGQPGRSVKTPFCVEPGKTFLQSVPLSAVFSLCRPERRTDTHEAAPLSQEQAFTVILSHLLDPVRSDRDAAFETVSVLVNRLPMYQLTVGTRLRSLPEFLDQLVGPASTSTLSAS